MTERILRALAATLVFVATAVPISIGAADPAGPRLKGTLDPIGPFSLRDLEGRQVTDASFRGKILIVHQWSAACLPCVKGFPEVQKLYESLRADPSIAFVSFDMDPEPEKLGDWFREFRKEYSFPVLLAGEQFKSGGIPYNWIVDGDGFIRDGFPAPGGPAEVIAHAEAVKHRLPVSMLPPEAVAHRRAENAKEDAESK